MSYVYDIKVSLDGAIQDENPDRLLWFARIRDYMLHVESYDIRQSIELIINRFKEEGSKDPRMAHWLLNILQMCAVHCTDKFIVTLNDQAVLSPFRKVLTDQSYTTQFDEVVRLKLFTLLKAWHEQYKEFFPESAFKKVYEDVFYGGEQSVLQPVTLHWFPNRNIVNEALDSIPYDLVRVGKELLSCGNKSFYSLNFLCAYPEHSSIKRVQAEPQDLVNEASMTLMRMEADVWFWDDIMQHADIPEEYSQTIATIGDDLRKLKSDVEQIFENLNNSGPSSSRSGDQRSDRQGYALSLEAVDRSFELQSAQPATHSLSSRPDEHGYSLHGEALNQVSHDRRTGENRTAPPITDSLSSRPSEQGYGMHVEALSQASHNLRTGENRNSELQFGRPTTSSLSSRPGEQGYGMHGSHDLQTGENRSSELHSGWRTAGGLSSRPGDQGYDMPTKPITQPSDDLRTRPNLSSENQSGQPIPRPRSSHMDPASNIPKRDASVIGSQSHTINARDGQPKDDFEEVRDRYQSRLADQNSRPQINASAGDRSVVSQSQSKPNSKVGIGRSASDARVPHSTPREGHQRANRAIQNWMCPICRTGFQEKQEYIIHISSKEHKEAVAALPPL